MVTFDRMDALWRLKDWRTEYQRAVIEWAKARIDNRGSDAEQEVREMGAIARKMDELLIEVLDEVERLEALLAATSAQQVPR